MLYITPECFECGKTTAVVLTLEQVAAIDAGSPIQEVLPEMSPEYRETLISGTHPQCWFERFD